jgi:TPP-dependent pyruvate/acetoin dehydrogenase alpha subunit
MTDIQNNAVRGGLQDADALSAAYRMMVLIREFENEVQRQFLAGTILGSTHLCNGQEAVSAGVAAALADGDQVAATYRGHGHTLARGVTPMALMAELMGRVSGMNHGLAGGMNVIDRDRGLLGCYGIIGGSIAAATGAAIAGKRDGTIAVALFGDATCNQAYFHECANFAVIRKLPLVLVCENNLYGEYTAIERSTGGDLTARAAAYGMIAEKVDGNNVVAVADATAQAAARARAGDGPTFLECLTYRHLGHSKADPGTYRPKEEVEAWKARDPLPATRRLLLEQHGVPAAAVDALEQDAAQAVADAAAQALAADTPDPTTTTLTEYADVA